LKIVHLQTKFKAVSFQAYIDNIKVKTGKTPNDFKKLAEKKGFLQNGELIKTVKATEITNWLKDEFELGHGHAMAIYAAFKGKTE
jgi:Domain of unknown function (DUF4287)